MFYYSYVLNYLVGEKKEYNHFERRLRRGLHQELSSLEIVTERQQELRL